MIQAMINVLDDQQSRELRIQITCSAVYLYDIVNKYSIGKPHPQYGSADFGKIRKNKV